MILHARKKIGYIYGRKQLSKPELTLYAEISCDINRTDKCLAYNLTCSVVPYGSESIDGVSNTGWTGAHHHKVLLVNKPRGYMSASQIGEFRKFVFERFNAALPSVVDHYFQAFPLTFHPEV